jgi:hypothetical protein
MGANIAGIYGAQIFRQDDRPLYRRGFSINIAVLTVGLALAVLRFVDDFIRRRRHRKTLTSDPPSNEDIKAPRPSDVQPAPVIIGGDLKPIATGAVPVTSL